MTDRVFFSHAELERIHLESHASVFEPSEFVTMIAISEHICRLPWAFIPAAVKCGLFRNAEMKLRGQSGFTCGNAVVIRARQGFDSLWAIKNTFRTCADD